MRVVQVVVFVVVVASQSELEVAGRRDIRPHAFIIRTYRHTDTNLQLCSSSTLLRLWFQLALIPITDQRVNSFTHSPTYHAQQARTYIHTYVNTETQQAKSASQIISHHIESYRIVSRSKCISATLILTLTIALTYTPHLSLCSSSSSSRPR